MLSPQDHVKQLTSTYRFKVMKNLVFFLQYKSYDKKTGIKRVIEDTCVSFLFRAEKS